MDISSALLALIITNDATGQDQTSTITQMDDHTLKLRWGGAADALSPSSFYDMPITVAANGIYVFERE
jgi:hypothetical protein